MCQALSSLPTLLTERALGASAIIATQNSSDRQDHSHANPPIFLFSGCFSFHFCAERGTTGVILRSGHRGSGRAEETPDSAPSCNIPDCRDLEFEFDRSPARCGVWIAVWNRHIRRRNWTDRLYGQEERQPRGLRRFDWHCIRTEESIVK